MADPLSLIGARDVWDFLKFLRGVAGADVIATQFKWDGTRVEGSEKIVIHKHREEEYPDRFWYEVEALDDYTFLRFPVVESCAHEPVGTVKGQKTPTLDTGAGWRPFRRAQLSVGSTRICWWTS